MAGLNGCYEGFGAVFGERYRKSVLLRKLLGEPKLPQSACSYFYCLSGFLFLLSAQFTAFACETSQSGFKSKRIALVAVLQ
ncbi:hypothetical protein [Pseudomonas sp. RC10]|uniref:hypothetical protein n=1 Tax=Pseudomonas bambusae TaxID=3139142 RepID=UPI00313A3FC6